MPSPTPAFLPPDPARILLLKPSSLGDVIHALPVLRVLRRAFPAAEIWWWIDAGLRPLLEDDPDLTGLIPFNRRALRKPSGWLPFVRSLREMRRRQFDWVLDLQALARSGLVTWWSHARFSVGLDDRREGAPAFYDLAVPRPTPLTHAVDWYLEVPRRLGLPVKWDFDWIPPRPAVAARLRERWRTDAARWVAVQPGARWATKRWPARHFAAVIRALAGDDPALRFALLGSPDERDLAREIAEAAPDRCLVLAGETTLPEMVEWLRLAALLITNDTGPLHAAAAMRRPVLALFGPTEPRRTGPYGQLDHVLQLGLDCVPCLHHDCRHPVFLECLRGLTPPTVIARARELLAEQQLPRFVALSAG
jgi:lipopolysaccharide heptosyltransferase II